jgi:hypothetical protein
MMRRMVNVFRMLKYGMRNCTFVEVSSSRNFRFRSTVCSHCGVETVIVEGCDGVFPDVAIDINSIRRSHGFH